MAQQQQRHFQGTPDGPRNDSLLVVYPWVWGDKRAV